MSNSFIYIFNFVIGSIIGSHLLVIVQRFETENFITDKSHCDNCQIPLTLLNQIPIFSFLRYQGKCFFCHAYIPIETFYCEILGGLAFMPLNPLANQTSYFFIIFIFLISIFDYIDQSFPVQILIPLIAIVVFKIPYSTSNYTTIEWILISFVILIFLIMNLKKKFGYGDTIIFIILIFYYNFYIAEYLFYYHPFF
jgi:leader peptidase (prepilin peptidase)/N-methyltransferase